jgi:hypothetical protein
MVKGMTMTDNNNQSVRDRAYYLWEVSGRPEGEHLSHWQQALEELGLVTNAEQIEWTSDPEELDTEAAGAPSIPQTNSDRII